MGLFARDEKDSKNDGFAPPEGLGEEPRPAPRREPVPIDRRRADAEEREMTVHLGTGSRVSGKLSFDGPARIAGELEGEVVAQETLIIEESAVVTAQIVGTTIVIKGTVNGNVRASERIEMRAPAKLCGDIVSPTVVIHEGARFEGRCSMGGSEAETETRKVASVASVVKR
ncbi:MAG: bactofilin family protein [Candidatus Binatia bacterium]